VRDEGPRPMDVHVGATKTTLVPLPLPNKTRRNFLRQSCGRAARTRGSRQKAARRLRPASEPYHLRQQECSTGSDDMRRLLRVGLMALAIAAKVPACRRTCQWLIVLFLASVITACAQGGIVLNGSSEFVQIYMPLGADGKKVLVTAQNWCSQYGKRAANLKILIRFEEVSYECVSGAGQNNTDRSRPPNPVISSGSAFFVSSDGTLITNNHVVEGCDKINVMTVDGRTVRAEVLTLDKINDLAILNSDFRPKNFAYFRSGPPLRQGEEVLVYGFPLSSALASSGNLTAGYVSALFGIKDDVRYLQISAEVQPGNSGGPLVDLSGNVVGVVTSKLNSVRVAAAIGDIPQNVNFALKSSIVEMFMATHSLHFRSGVSSSRMSIADVGQRTRDFTAKIQCEK
jgi:S1-C subfamily serine protease